MCSTIETYSLIQMKSRASIRLEKIDKYPLIRMNYKYRLILATKDFTTKFTDIYLNDYELHERFYFPLMRVLKGHLDYVVTTIHNRVEPEELVYYRFHNSLFSKFLEKISKIFGADIYLKTLYILDKQDNLCIVPEIYLRFFLFKYKLPELQPMDYVLSSDEANKLLNNIKNLI